jgi:hypothetical protein
LQREATNVHKSTDALWHTLALHFANHIQQVERFRNLGRGAVRRMWASQTNEGGEPLSQFEREALIERHCELFGVWPR